MRYKGQTAAGAPMNAAGVAEVGGGVSRRQRCAKRKVLRARVARAKALRRRARGAGATRAATAATAATAAAVGLAGMAASTGYATSSARAETFQEAVGSAAAS